MAETDVTLLGVVHPVSLFLPERRVPLSFPAKKYFILPGWTLDVLKM
jgi:hypothetical protein